MDLPLNKPQRLICHKTKPNQSKIGFDVKCLPFNLRKFIRQSKQTSMTKYYSVKFHMEIIRCSTRNL